MFPTEFHSPEAEVRTLPELDCLRRNTAGEVSAGGSGQTVETRLLRRNAAGAVWVLDEGTGGPAPTLTFSYTGHSFSAAEARATSLERGGCGTEIHALINVLFLRG